MAFVRYTRIDGQNSSNCCLIICILGFVSTCLLGAWMTLSSSVGSVRTGISVEKFMGGMPKIVMGGDAALPEAAGKVNASRGSVQEGRGPRVSEESKRSDSVENHKVETSVQEGSGHRVSEESKSPDSVANHKAETSVQEGSGSGVSEESKTSDSVENHKAETSVQEGSGPRASEESKSSDFVENHKAETSVQEGSGPRDSEEPKSSDSVENHKAETSVQEGSGPRVSEESKSSDSVENHKDENSVQEGSGPRVSEESKGSDSVENHKADSKKGKIDEAEKEQNAQKVKEDMVIDNGDLNKGAEEKKNGQDEIVASDQSVIREKSEDVVQAHDDDGKLGPKESSGDLKQSGEKTSKAGEYKSGETESKVEGSKSGETESKADESKGDQDKISATKENIDATKIHDGMVDQSETSSQGNNKHIKEDTNGKSSKSESIGEKIPNETAPQPHGMPWPTQSAQSEKEKLSGYSLWKLQDYRWKVCNVSTGPDYIPCLDNIHAIKKLRTTRHYEHRERHCPEEAPTCLVPLPKGYRTPVKWPKSRDMIWFVNVPHTKLVDYKGKQNWVKVYDRYLTFPGGGTQFKFGALHYVDYIQQTVPDIDWGKRSRVVLDVGCGVASFGGYLFDRDVLTMSLAPKDEHEAQVQFALERGIPAISAVMGTKRLPFPSMVFDVVHCARCRVPWHIEGGKLLLELNRLLRPGGYFVWSATPVYRKNNEDSTIWNEMSRLTKSMCWKLVKVGKDGVNRKSAAIFRKTTSNECYKRRQQNDPPLCKESDNPNEAWYTPLQQCIHKVAKDPSERGFRWPAPWPSRLEETPYWLKDSALALSPKDFTDDDNHWKHVIANSYLNGIGIDWSLARNVMDMKASFGGFAAALKDLKLWVMNVVPVNSSDTLPIIYERGLFGIYHDWCESFSTYPRSYDILHADHLFSDLKIRCNFVSVIAEVDRILRPGGRLIVRDDSDTISEIEGRAKSLHWKITHYNDNEGLLCIMKTLWRPSQVETIAGAIA